MFFLVGIQFVFSQTKRELITELTLNFDTESSSISNTEAQKVTAIIKDLKADLSTYSLEISAYTDNQGSVDYNKELAAKRAIASADFFVKIGFHNRKISYNSQGEFHPLSDNESEIGRAKNRRATIKIYQNEDDKIAIGGFTIKEKLYTIDTSNPQEVVYESGTRITIPENAFEDKNGNPIIGDVQLSYIEYRDPVDFILGNIPMDIKQDGESLHFNSGGMFKIKASKNEEEVFLKKDKLIDIDFPLVENLPDMNFYEFDEEKNVWIKKVENITVNENQLVNLDLFLVEQRDNNPKLDSISSQAFNLINTIKSEINSDGVDCSKMYHNLKLGKLLTSSSDTLYRKTQVVPVMLRKMNLKKQKGVEYQILSSEKIKKNRINEGKKYEIKCTIISEKEGNLNNLKITVLTDSYINKLNEINWISSKSLENQKLKSIELKSISKKSQNLYQISFRDSLNLIVFDSLKVVDFNLQKEKILDNIINQLKNRQVQLKRIDNLVSNYNKVIQNKAKIIDNYKKIRYTTNDTVKMYSKLVENFWEFNRDFMTNEEKALDKNQWVNYFDENKILMANRYKEIEANKKFQDCFNNARERDKFIERQNRVNNTAANVRQKLQISSLGIYNCDQIQRLQEPIIIYAKYENEQEQKVVPLFIYIVDKSINGILKYDGYNGYDPSKFAISSKSECTLLAFDSEGNAYIYNLEKMKSLKTIKNQSKNKLILVKIETIENRDQLSALLN